MVRPLPSRNGVAVSEIAHDFTGLLRHEGFLLSLFQRVVDRFANVVRMSEEVSTLFHVDVGRVCVPIFSSPREHTFKERFVRS